MCEDGQCIATLIRASFHTTEDEDAYVEVQSVEDIPDFVGEFFCVKALSDKLTLPFDITTSLIFTGTAKGMVEFEHASPVLHRLWFKRSKMAKVRTKLEERLASFGIAGHA